MGSFWRSTLINEKAALLTFALTLVFALLFGASMGFAKLIPAGMAIIALLILALLSVFGLVWAKHEVDYLRWRSAITAPILLGGLLLLGGPMIGIGLKISALVHLSGREHEFRETKVDGYSVLPFRSGITDGGVAIIHTIDLSPDKLTQRQMIDLVGERIHWCNVLRDSYYICGYD